MIDLKLIQHYLNIEIVRERNSLFLRQIVYLTKILKRFDMQNCSILNSFMKSRLDKILKFTKKNQQIDFEIVY